MDPHQTRPNRPIRVLHLEDNPRDAELIQQRLKANALAFDVVWVDAKQAFESALARRTFDLVIVDYNLPHYDGMSALARIRERHPELPVIVVSGTLSEEEAVECLKAGANDYVLKQRLQRLDVAVTRVLQEAAQRQRRRQAEEALRDSEERFRATFEQAAVGMALRGVDPRNPRWLRVNQKLCDILGYTREELLQLTSVDLTPPEDRDLAVDYNEKLLRGEIASYSREKRYVRKDGQVIWADISLSVVRGGPQDQPTHIISVIQDVTERRQAAEQIVRLSRIHALISGVNTMIVRTRDRQRLLDEACEIAVRIGGFRMAWIGFVDARSLDVVPAATAGHEAGYLKIIWPSADPDAPGGQGISGRAIRARRPVVLEEFAHDLKLVDPEEALRRGYRAGISLPLVMENNVVGVMNLYSGETGVFDDKEIGLLSELTADISFALEHIEKQQKIDQLSRITAVSSEINAAIVRIHEKEALLRETCRIASEHGKFGLVWIGLLDPEKQDVRAVAWKGFSPEAARAVSWASIDSTRGALRKALRTRKVAVRNDIGIELLSGKLRNEALPKGYYSTACLPLVVDDKVAALISLFATERGFFDKDELKLLDEVASNVSFALQSITRQEKLEYLSYYDVLTGLPNRHLFIDRLSQQMRSRSGDPQMIALILLDLERFRNVNESIGHRGGDELLVTIARRLEHAFRGRDYLARISSNGFGIIVRGIKGIADVVHVIENEVYSCFGSPFLVADGELRLSARTGIAMFPADGQDADTLFRNAEAALRRARVSGDRNLFYAAKMNAEAAHLVTLESRLRVAVEKQQFVLHYQPKFDTRTMAMTGLEALIRWADPDKGLVPPAQFIPLLEQTGMILEVGRWALQQAVADFQRWRGGGLAPPRIAVNVSAIQLRQDDFVETVRSVMTCSAAPDGKEGCGLDLEITESLVMEDIEQNIAKLKAMQEMGLGIYIDDFGTGYSSLSYIARLPIDALKIDRAFVDSMAANPDDMTIVSTIISLAHALKLSVVAEGVETDEQRRLLALLKCDEVQGYLFSRPVPAEQIERLLREQKTLPG